MLGRNMKRLVIVCFSLVFLLEVSLADDHENEEPDSVAPTFVQDEEEGKEELSSVGPTIFQTKSGSVSGITSKTDEGKEVNVFLGIPYAEPPVGELRFKPPKKIEPWKSVLQAVRPLPICHQQMGFKNLRDQFRLQQPRPWSENCLHLNIWSPNPKPKNAPVLFFIHGGAFLFGSGLFMVDGSSLASEGVVVVSFNYRLGVFGFFNLGTAESPGNLGLMDQNLALRWVRENIDVFGGDPEAVTLMGISAGGASVGYHILAPTSRGLFRKAIMMSGSPTNIWGNVEPEKNIEQSQKLMTLLGCQSPNSTESFRCIQNKHPEDLLEASDSGSPFTNFVPTVDGQFIVEHPSVSVEAGSFNTADVLIGNAEDEGGMFMQIQNPDVFQTKDGRLFRRDFESVVARSSPKLSAAQVKALDIVYTDWANPNDPFVLRNAGKDIYSDLLFNCHINELADKLSETEATVYRYVYGHKLTAASFMFPSWVGASHGSDQLPILGPAQFLKQFPQTPQDLEGLKRFRMHVLNFINKGNPNIKESGYPEEPEWPTYDSKRRHLHFSEKSFVSSNYRQRECATWLKLLPLLQEKKC